MKFFFAAVLAVLLGAPALQPAWAQGQGMYRGSRIIGAELRDASSHKLGRITDLILDSERGEVAYVVADFGGTAGKGKLYAIPWKAVRPGDDDRHYILQADRETIRGAPGFDAGRWPDLADNKWSREVERYWNRMVGQAPRSGVSSESGSNTTSGARGAEAARPSR